MKNLLIISSTKNSNFQLSQEIKNFFDKKGSISSSVISLEEFDLPLFKPSLEENFKQQYPNSSRSKEFKMQLGRKYWKISMWDVASDGVNFRTEGVHAFVDRNTGQVYKPASYKSPAKHVRYDLRLIKDRANLHNPNFTDWSGGYLYLR